jgi:transposase
MDDTTSLTPALVGLAGMRLLAAADAGGELEMLIETAPAPVGCPGCGVGARAKDRRPTWVRDLPSGGRPVVLCWLKRVWACPDPDCGVRTWTETHPGIAARATLTQRARTWALHQVGARDATVAGVARELGVAWWTVMNLVIARGTPLVDDPARVAPRELDGSTVTAAVTGPVTGVGVDETAFLRARCGRATQYVTGIVDLTPGRAPRLLDVVEGRSGTVLGDWLGRQDPGWRAQVTTASLDPFRGYATALRRQLPDAVRVLDPFHVVRLALAAVDEVRRRVQQATHGHRGRTGDPLYGVRRLLRQRHDRLSATAAARLRSALIAGDPDGEVHLAWQVAQHVMAAYHLNTADPDKTRGRLLMTATVDSLRSCPIPELARLGRTLRDWRAELLAAFDHPGVTNGGTENTNLKVKNTKRAARGYRNFDHYRLRLLLNHGRLIEDHSPTRIRTRRPSFAA